MVLIMINEDVEEYKKIIEEQKKEIKQLKEENEQLKKENEVLKMIVNKLELERCQFLNDKQAKSKWGDNYDKW